MIKSLQLCIIFSFIFGNIDCTSKDLSKAEPTTAIHNSFFGIAITHTKNETFNDVFTEVKHIGTNFVALPIYWDDIEKSPKKYNPKPNFLKIANTFYPANNTKVALELNPIDTVKTRIPSDLSGKGFNDPKFINRFKSFIDWSFLQISDLSLVSLTIGNEIDIYLGNDEKKWREYEIFFTEIYSHIKKLRPNLKVGTKITYNGLTKNTSEFAKSINSKADVVLTTYYHLKDDFTVKDPKAIAEIFENTAKLYPNKEIYFLEIGMPSGKLCDSSEKKQAEFITETFENWDKHENHIKLLNFTWLTDLSTESLDFYTKYYGVTNKGFREYLATLGLRTKEGKAKLAFKRLKNEVKKRKMLK